MKTREQDVLPINDATPISYFTNKPPLFIFLLLLMDLSFKKVLAGVSTAAIAFTQVGTAFAAYSDVPAGSWFGEAVDAFVDAGYLDANQTRFRGGDLANRAEFVKLVVELNGGILSTPPASPTFDDVAASAWYYGYMEEAAKEGWVKGDKDCAETGANPCYARPSANINRAEAAALIVRAFALEATGDAPQFVDNPNGQWYTDSIQTAADACVLQGDDSTGRVRPSDNMNRAEMVVMLHRVDQGLTYGVDCGGDEPGSMEPGVDSAVATSETEVEVEFTVSLDQDSAEDTANYEVWDDNDNEIDVTDAQLVEDMVVKLTLDSALDPDMDYKVMVSGVMSEDGDEIEGDASFSGYSDVPVSDGSLEFAIASTNPVTDTVPKGANGVTVLSLDVAASCDDDVIVEDITVLHEGFGDTSDIDGVYLSMDGARLSRKRTIDSDNQTAELRLRTPLVVDSCDTVTLDVVVDFNTTATTSGEHNFVVELPSDVTSNAQQVTGNFPLRGNTFKVAAITSGIVTITYRTVSPDEVDVGELDATLGRFEVSTNATEDQTLYSMTVRQNGSVADGDLTDLAIQRSDGTVVSNTVPAFVGDSATFVFDPPLTIKQGDKLTFEIVGDVVGGAEDTVILDFEETGDVFAVGSLYGYGVNGQLYGSQVSITSSPSADTVNINAGEFTIELNGPVQQSYTDDSDDAVLANMRLASGDGDDVDVKKLFFAIQGQTSSGQTLDYSQGDSYNNIHEVLENVEVRNTKTGRTVQPTRLTDSSTFGQSTQTAGNYGTFQIYRLDDLIVKGDETFEIRADFISNGSGISPRSGDQFRVVVCTEAQNENGSDNTTGCDFGGILSGGTSSANEGYQLEIEGLSTGDDVDDVRPGGSITGNYHRIASAGLTIALKSLGTSDTAVKNTKNITLNRFEARAGEAKDILLTNVIFNSASGSLNNAQNYTLWADTDSDSKVDTIVETGVSPQSSKVTFSQFKNGGFVIPKEQTVVFELHADIVTNTTNDDLKVDFAIGETNYIEAEELDTGSALSGIGESGSGDSESATACSGTCDITVTVVASKNYYLISSGDLYVSLDTTPVRNRQLLGGELGDTVLRLNFHAENEDIDVTDLQLNSSGSTASSVDRLELYKDGAATPFATATVGACGSDDVLHANTAGGVGNGSTQAFCAQMESRQLVVKKGEDVDVLVRPRMKTDVDGATPNQAIAFFIAEQAVSNNTTGSGAVRARGDQSSSNLIANDADSTADGEIFIGRTSVNASNARINGNRHVSVLSKITSITNANPDANGTSVPSGVSAIAQFKIAAAAHSNSQNGLNKVTLSGVIFNVTATNVNLSTSTFKFYNKADQNTTVTCTTMTTGGTTITGTASGSFLVQCANLIATVNTAIDQGSDQTFVLQANITNPKTGTSTSSLQVALQDFTSISNTTFGASTSHLQWRDADNASATTATFNWVEYPETSIKSTTYNS